MRAQALTVTALLFLAESAIPGDTSSPAQSKDIPKEKITVFDKSDRGSLDKYVFRNLIKVKSFVPAVLLFDGSAEELHLDKEEITDFIKLRFKNTFTGYEMKNAPATMEEKDLPEWGTIGIAIMTTGTSYPVAYSVECEIGQLGWGAYPIRGRTLGFASVEKLKTTRILKDAIANAMEDAATQLMKVQGKL